MCGIAGFAGKGTQLPDISSMVSCLNHRGPDDSGSSVVSVKDVSVVFGQTRLSILDLTEAGHQPMYSRDGRWLLTYNGEIYNHLDIRSDLEGPFRGHSDTETLVESLAAWGIKRTLPSLNGMFAFAALDTYQGMLYLVRDPFGIKPLYYRHHSGYLSFSSEIRALRLSTTFDTQLDSESLQTFLTLRYIPSPRTLWKEIQRLPPGHVLEYNLASGTCLNSRYISPTETRFSGNEQDATEAYRDVLGEAVRRQMLSDVPVGILLSGGIDSALVATLARETGRKPPCFSVGFGGGHRECELAAAAETAAVLGLPHIPVLVNTDLLWDALPRIVASVEEPLGTTSILPMWYLVEQARKDVTVVLTGQGSDEPWGGYTRYQAEIVRKHLPLPRLLKYVEPFSRLLSNVPEVIERTLRSLPVDDLDMRFGEEYALFSGNEREALTGRSDDGGAVGDISAWLRWLSPLQLEPVEKMMRIDSRMNLADDLLLYGDKISMAFSLEARVPMLDLEVVRFIESLPRQYRVVLGKRKIIHKKMAESLLPTEIVHREKKGFHVPFGNWIRTVWKKRSEDILLESGSPHLDFLNRNAITKLWQEHQSGYRDHSRKLFALLMLAIWFRQGRV